MNGISSHVPQKSVHLPLGFHDASGRVHRHAVLRKMTGHEEQLFYDQGVNPGRLVTALLAACMLELGDLAEVDQKLVGQLYLADRNFLLLELRRFTLGDYLSAVYQCPDCNASIRVSEDLSTLTVRNLEPGAAVQPRELELEDGYRDPDGTVHKKMELTAPRGVDEELAGLLARKDPLRAQDALVLRCIRSFGTLSPATLSGLGVEILRSLTLADRRSITRVLNELTLGPDFTREIQCTECGHRFEAPLDVSAFFAQG